ncbi:hypothetical protein FA95DRAFT_991430 [Auriscalpium vulgare]|uniref:Uncharacterized protein n=1 Tax=Auriscalpium vulgare TaxID=40419 RepID=A0ACB8R6P4_9AGAM|nr:hypothetical protein FA95DRAFT_991430 [Auriscalpium vulgare]
MTVLDRAGHRHQAAIWTSSSIFMTTSHPDGACKPVNALSTSSISHHAPASSRTPTDSSPLSPAYHTVPTRRSEASKAATSHPPPTARALAVEHQRLLDAKMVELTAKLARLKAVQEAKRPEQNPALNVIVYMC